jgi:hypothetical protein
VSGGNAAGGRRDGLAGHDAGCWYSPPGIITWPALDCRGTPALEEPAMAGGWKCLDCGTIMAPWVPEHRCPPGGGAQLLKSEAIPDGGSTCPCAGE